MSSCGMPRSRSPPESEGHALLQAGKDLLVAGNYTEARETVLRAMDLIQNEGNTARQPSARTLLSVIYMGEDRYQDAHDQLLQNLEYYQKEQNLEMEGQTYQLIHMAHMGKMEYDQAEEDLNKAVQIYRKMGSKLLEGNAELFRGQIWEKRGDKEKALNGYETALKFYAEAEDTRNVDVVKGAIKKLQDATSS